MPQTFNKWFLLKVVIPKALLYPRGIELMQSEVHSFLLIGVQYFLNMIQW